jgi:hypothetical protein
LISFDGSCVKKTFHQRYSSGNYWGIIGLAAGLFLGFAFGAILAKVLHISSFEGGAGYFAVVIALLVTVLVRQSQLFSPFTSEVYAGFGYSLDW